jgi:hypothetical protein
MRMTIRLLFVASLALLSVSVAPAWAQASAHDGAAATSTRAGASTTRWKADANLRAGMARIRRDVAGLAHYQHGHIGPQQAVILAADVERDVGFVVSHCTLAPQADAALHPVLAELLRGAQAIQSHPTNLAAIPPMQRALQRYPVSFDDPGWPVGG